MVEVHWLACALGDVPKHDEWLSAGERETLASLRVPKRRDDWRLGRWTAKAALRTAWPKVSGGHPAPEVIEIVAAEDGAPELSERRRPVPAFSISHSGGVAVCAVAPPAVRVGVDIEQVQERSSAFVRDFFSASEQKVVEATPAERRALVANLIWSAKESALKAQRTGLRADTRSVEVGWSNAGPAELWSPLTVTPAGAAPLQGWWMAGRHGVVTLLAQPAPALPVEVSARVSI